MGMGRDFVEDNAFDLYDNTRYAQIREELSECTDDELINNAISAGDELDNFEHFPAYSIAIKIKNNQWKLTQKQRDAFINCLAYFFNEEERDGV